MKNSLQQILFIIKTHLYFIIASKPSCLVFFSPDMNQLPDEIALGSGVDGRQISTMRSAGTLMRATRWKPKMMKRVRI